MNVRRITLSVAIACAACLVSGIAAAGSASAQPGRSAPRLTWARLSTLPPGQVAALQNPLVAVANDIAKTGITQLAGLYTATALETPDHAVRLYVTNTKRAAWVLRAAKESDPALNLTGVEIVRSAYSAAALDKAASRLVSASVAGRTPFTIFSAVQSGTGQALQLRVAHPAAARLLAGQSVRALGGQSVRQFAGVALTFARGVKVAPFSRENDSAPFIGGDYAFGWNSNQQDRPVCSLGIAVENSSGQDGLMEAGHCFSPGNEVYTENYGHRIGQPGLINHTYDAEIVWTSDKNGAGSNADEGESDLPNGGIHYFPLVSARNPAENEYVCQDGIESYILRKTVPCNLKVGGSITYPVTSADGYHETVHGVLAKSNNGNPVGAQGDSGAVVFTIGSPSTRIAAGMVDAGPSGCNPDCTELYFIPQSDVMGAFDVHLNPHQ